MSVIDWTGALANSMRVRECHGSTKTILSSCQRMRSHVDEPAPSKRARRVYQHDLVGVRVRSGGKRKMRTLYFPRFSALFRSGSGGFKWCCLATCVD